MRALRVRARCDPAGSHVYLVRSASRVTALSHRLMRCGAQSTGAAAAAAVRAVSPTAPRHGRFSASLRSWIAHPTNPRQTAGTAGEWLTEALGRFARVIATRDRLRRTCGVSAGSMAFTGERSPDTQKVLISSTFVLTDDHTAAMLVTSTNQDRHRNRAVRTG
jgi:hypothetical protein